LRAILALVSIIASGATAAGMTASASANVGKVSFMVGCYVRGAIRGCTVRRRALLQRQCHAAKALRGVRGGGRTPCRRYENRRGVVIERAWLEPACLLQ
jgi:hypothetical protein